MPKGLLKPTLLITGLSIIGIFVSFFSQLVIAYFFGATFERDAYFFASTIPTYISAVFTGSLGFIFLPKVVSFSNNAENIQLNKFLSSVLSLIIIFLLILALLFFLFSNEIVNCLSGSYSISQKHLIAKILIIISPTMILNVVSNFLSSLYQIRHNFFRPAIAPIITTLINIFFVIAFSNQIGILSLAIGFLIGSLISCLSLLPILRDFKFKFTLNFRNSDLLSLLKISFPLLVTGIIFRTTNVFERIIASDLPVGSISYLGYAGQLMIILSTVTSNGIAASIYPLISRFWVEKCMDQVYIYFRRGIRIIFLIALPLSILFVLFGDLIIKVVFERGAFNHNTTIAVYKTFSIMTFAFIANCLGNVVVKIFYLSNKTIIASISEIAGLLFYLIPAYFLSKVYGYIGMAVATSIGASLSIIVSFILVLKILKDFNIHLLIADILKIIYSLAIASFVSLILYYLNPFATLNIYVLILVISSILLVLYLILLNFFKNEEAVTLKVLLKKYHEKVFN